MEKNIPKIIITQVHIQIKLLNDVEKFELNVLFSQTYVQKYVLQLNCGLKS